MDSSSWKEYSKIDPEYEALLPNLPPNKSFADYGTPDELRKAIMDQMMAFAQIPGIKLPDFTGVEKKQIQIPVRDGTSIRAVHYRPENSAPGPLFVHYFAGGFVFGAPEMHEAHFEVLTKELGITVVGVEYRKAPEHVFPTAAYDAIDSAKWIAENASKLGADPSKGFIVGGCSAGGDLAAVVAHEAVDSKLSPPITGVFLNVPVLIHWDNVPEKYRPHYKSFEENGYGQGLDKKAMLWFIDTYKGDGKSPLVSPLLWPSGHKNQPPTYFQVCGMDPLRDDSLIYEHVLREECGVPTKIDVYPGIPHAFQELMPLLSTYKKAQADLKAGFEWILSQKSR